MGLSIRLLEKPGYIHLVVTGENTRENVAGWVAALRDECARRRWTAALVEEDLKGPSIGFADAYEIVCGNVDWARSGLSAIAYVDVNPEHDLDLLKFAETVAVNRAVRLRLFRSVAEAERWLGEAAGARPRGPADPPA
jgi:hypothetical protein